MRIDIYERVTNAIIEELEKGVRPWMKPWNSEHAAGRITRPLRSNMVPYQGINVLMLWSESVARGYASPIWMTFKQALEFGGHVRNGEKGTPVVFASKLTRTETAESGEALERDISFLKCYAVFNTEQIDGLPGQFNQPVPERSDPVQRIAHADAYMTACGADIAHGGTMAAYNITTDRVRMPPFEAFRDAESYYATLAHELTHWTRHKSRLDRDFGRARFGDEGYAMEELVAELGSAFVCADLDLTPALHAENAAYIDNWLSVLKGDKRAIFTAASHAQRAADFLHGLQPTAEDGLVLFASAEANRQAAVT
ncbi:MAG: ssDNA-binding domain-containing protein [Pseudorhodoplanes sp.]|nr:ssDNA-binding domain-containing protein [Pseudorhodoplanes sp.]